MKMETRKIVSVIMMSLGMSLVGQAYAQQDYPRIIKRIPAEEEFLRIDEALKLGDFIVKPKIGFTEYYDSNIFATRDDEINDSVSMIKAAMAFDSDWKSHALNIDMGLDVSRYAEYDTENTVDNWLSLHGKYTTTPGSHVFAEASLIRDHEDRASPDELNGTEPTQFNETRINAGYLQQIHRHSLTLAINDTKYDFRDVSTSIGTIDNDTRDHTITTAGLRFNYALSKGYFLFLQANSDRRDYELPLDGNGYNRDSDGSNSALGFKFNRSFLLQGEIFVGRLSQKFDDAQFNKISEADFGAQTRWFATPDTAFNLIIDRSLEETTLAGASAFLYTQYALRADQRINPQWFFNINASYGSADYHMLTREDIYRDYGIGISFSFIEGLTFAADYHQQQRESSEPADDYSRNQIMLSVSARL